MIFTRELLSVSPVLANWFSTIYQPRLNVNLPECNDHCTLNPHRRAQSSVTLSIVCSTTSLCLLLFRCSDWLGIQEAGQGRPPVSCYLTPTSSSSAPQLDSCDHRHGKEFIQYLPNNCSLLPLLEGKKKIHSLSSSCVFVLQRFAGETKPATGSPS